jgi:Na+/phosphate symporter
MLLTVLLALVGWGVGYWSTLRRDRLSKKRDLRTQYLIEAHRRLESAGNRSTNTSQWAHELESAVADIQLFGSSEQVRRARTFALEFAEHGHAALDELLESLRIDLRKELDLVVAEDCITYLRIGLDRKSASK